MYIALTGSENNKDVYIYHSFRKENGKSSSRIYKKLGKYNTLLEQFDGDRDKMMAWAREQADKETKLYKEATGKISVEFSKAACIPMNPFFILCRNHGTENVTPTFFTLH